MDFISETCTNFKLQSDYNLVYQCQNVNITVFVVATTMRLEEKEQTFFDKSAEQMKPISLSSVWTSQRARIQIKYTHLRNRNVWQWNKNWLSATKRGDEGEKNDRQMWREKKTNGWYNEKNVQRIDSEIEQIKSEEWKVRNESARNNMRCSDWCAIFFSAGASASRW